MRLLVLSDLHLEVWGDQLPKIDVAISKPDVVILAGDIHTRSRAPSWAGKTFPGLPVVYVAGNHEFYGESIEKTVQALSQECAHSSKVQYLDCDEYILRNIRFLGATLWTDFSLFGVDRKTAAMRMAQFQMNDYKRVKVASSGFRKLRPEDTAWLHAIQRTWLWKKLHEPFVGHTVVVTHMAPSMLSVAPQYAAEQVSAAFASNLDDMVAKADVWIHGHTHVSFDYHLGKCRVVSNPLGYRMRNGSAENSDFDPAFVVEL